MKYKVLEDFENYEEVEQDVISLYKNKIPKKLLDIWKESIPVMLTGFGDIITWEKNRYLGIVKYRKGTFDIIEDGFEYFLNDIMSPEYVRDFLDDAHYKEAIIKNGKLNFEECFGYVPLLGLGGSEKIENLKKVKIKEHITLIIQMVGKIE